MSDLLEGFCLDAQAMGNGTFGAYGGSWIPELLVPTVDRVAEAWEDARKDPEFLAQYLELCRQFIGRPTPLQEAKQLTKYVGAARILLKREDLAHTGAHKINNAIGQALLAQRMGFKRVIAETGAGQHGVATATACALLGLECEVHMGAFDVERQHPNVLRMELLGAELHEVHEGSRTLTDAVSSAVRAWLSDPEDSYYLLGSAVGMHPFPTIVRDFQSVIGYEIRAQCRRLFGRAPDAVVACVGGGSNAIGSFSPFIDDDEVALFGAEAGGEGPSSQHHAASINYGTDGVLHGAYTKLLQNNDGQILATHSISAGLDYPGVGPEHAQLAFTGRAHYRAVSDNEAMFALQTLCHTEGIIAAIESAHAVELGMQVARTLPADGVVVVTVSGRGEKDLATINAWRSQGSRAAPKGRPS